MSSEIAATPPQPAGPRRRRRPDWRHAAHLLARGLSPEAVARAIGTRPKYVLRQLRQSRRLARWVAVEHELLALPPLPVAPFGRGPARPDWADSGPVDLDGLDVLARAPWVRLSTA